MGMCLAIHTISDRNIARVLEEPPLIWRVIAPDEPEMYESAVEPKKLGFLARLLGKEPEQAPIDIPNLDFDDGESEETDLDKAWHGIHYLLTRTAWEGSKPLNFIVCGGNTVGDVDVGYGPARVFSSVEVSEICSALSAVDADFLRSAFNPEEMMEFEIYPEIWSRDPNDDGTLSYCVEYFDELRTFLNAAQSNNLGVVLALC